MYTLIRKRDNLRLEGLKFQNIRYKVGGNTLTDFPPEIGCGMVVWSRLRDAWQTTIVKSIEKINDDEYIVHTKNSTYNVKRKINRGKV